MQQFEQRVIEEKRELDVKIVKLVQFITASMEFKNLDVAEQELMRDQCDAMLCYSYTLGNRIKRFTAK